jgi:UDP-glucose 4-epimerase
MSMRLCISRRFSVVPESVANPIAYYKNNTANSLALIDAASRGGIKHIVFSSTAAIYGNPGAQLVGEDAVPRPISPYGTSKLMTETMLRDAASASDLKYIVLRYFNVAGADPKLRTGQSTRACGRQRTIRSSISGRNISTADFFARYQ